MMANIKIEKLMAIGICSLILALGTLTNVAGSQGSLALSVQGYGTVHGQLENATIQPNGSVSLLMLVNDQLQTSQGAFPTSVSGVWVGTLNGSTVSGQIQDVVGVVRICVLMCQNANFVGVGRWSGLLKGSDAAGHFDGAITFTSSPVPQIRVGQPIPVSGTWTTSFELPVPELIAEIWPYTLVFAVAVCALVTAESRRIHTE